MPGLNKRSNDPKSDQKKLEINPLYNTSALLKAAIDRVSEAMNFNQKANGQDKKKPKGK